MEIETTDIPGVVVARLRRIEDHRGFFSETFSRRDFAGAGIATAAIRNLLGGEAAIRHCRKPEIMGDAAHAILTRDSRGHTGNFYIDDEVLAEEGITDLEPYAMTPGVEPIPTFFV